MRKPWIPVAFVFVLVFATWASVGAGQEKPPTQPAAKPAEKPAEPAAEPRESGPQVPLRVTVIISRHRGDKKIASLPYVLGVVANGNRTTLRMGSDVPIPQPTTTGPSVNYRAVGTNIDCGAQTVSAGLFRLLLTVADSSVHLEPGDTPAAPVRAAEMPTFRTFHSSFAILLRDGQSAEYTSATDPVTGEVMKIDVALNVVK